LSLLNLLGISVGLAMDAFAVSIAAGLSAVGIGFGARLGRRWGRWAEAAGGCLLVLIGVRILATRRITDSWIPRLIFVIGPPFARGKPPPPGMRRPAATMSFSQLMLIDLGGDCSAAGAASAWCQAVPSPTARGAPVPQALIKRSR